LFALPLGKVLRFGKNVLSANFNHLASHIGITFAVANKLFKLLATPEIKVMYFGCPCMFAHSIKT
jgi:hypothetical protein